MYDDRGTRVAFVGWVVWAVVLLVSSSVSHNAPAQARALPDSAPPAFTLSHAIYSDAMIRLRQQHPYLDVKTLKRTDVYAVFTAWMAKYQKTYDLHDIFRRYNAFKANLLHVYEHNTQRSPRPTYTLTINQFSD